MSLESMLSPEGVITPLRASCKKNLLCELAGRAARLFDVDKQKTFRALQEREEIGSTGFGDGVAIPHARLEGLEGIRAVFARLETPIDFEAVDDAPVDLVFLLLAPVDAGAEHLKALAKISRLMRDPQLRRALRAMEDPDSAYAFLTESKARAA